MVFLALIAWLYLLLLQDKFAESRIELKPAAPLTAPAVGIIVPAQCGGLHRSGHRGTAGAVHFWRGTGAKWHNRAYGAA